MQPFAIAFATATLALIAKIVSDAWERHRQRVGIAAALAAEIGAYTGQFKSAQTVRACRELANYDHAIRRRRLQFVMKTLPTGHPVFDKVADKIGLLPVADASDVSSIYNAVTIIRLLMVHLGSAEMAEADDEVQIKLLRTIADTIEGLCPPAEKLVDRLQRNSKQEFLYSFWP